MAVAVPTLIGEVVDDMEGIFLGVNHLVARLAIVHFNHCSYTPHKIDIVHSNLFHHSPYRSSDLSKYHIIHTAFSSCEDHSTGVESDVRRESWGGNFK